MLKCLLLKTKDNRKFLTSEDNLLMVLEFVKTFNAEIYLAEIPEESHKEILKAKSLATAICDSLYQPKTEIKELKRLYPEEKAGRKEAIKLAQQITTYIRKQLLTGKEVSMKNLKKKYEKEKLSDACLCAHLSRIRKELVTEGLSITKLGAGRYKIGKQQPVTV